MQRLSLFTIALILTVMTSACNTLQGIGTDIQKGGQAIENAASK